MYYDDELYVELVKSSFLDTAVDMLPELCAELQGEPLRIYKSIPRSDAPLKWGLYSRARNTLPFQQLTAAIEGTLRVEWLEIALSIRGRCGGPGEQTG